MQRTSGDSSGTKVTRSTSFVEAKLDEDNVARPEVDIAVHMPGTSTSSVRREALVTSTSVVGRTSREQESTGSQRPVKRELSDNTYHCLNCRIPFERHHSSTDMSLCRRCFHSKCVKKSMRENLVLIMIRGPQCWIDCREDFLILVPRGVHEQDRCFTEQTADTTSRNKLLERNRSRRVCQVVC